MNIQPHQQRVIDEKSELDVKRAALSTFIEGSIRFAELDTTEKDRLRRQRVIMGEYSDVLNERIAAFGSAP